MSRDLHWWQGNAISLWITWIDSQQIYPIKPDRYKDKQYNIIFLGAAMIFYISGDLFQHIKPLVESDTAHSAER